MLDSLKARTCDMEDKTFVFSSSVKAFMQRLPKGVASAEQVKKILRSSNAVDLNFVESHESESKEDFMMRVKMARNEAKFTGKMLGELTPAYPLCSERDALCGEAESLASTFTEILKESERLNAINRLEFLNYPL